MKQFFALRNKVTSFYNLFFLNLQEKKKMAKINKQMESINVAEMQNIQNTHHSEIIEKLFGLYINVLKNRPYSKLMSLVLEGLAK